MKKNILLTMTFALMIVLSSCGGNTDVVDSGTYNGKIKKIEPEKTEIYVTLENGKTIELYFIEETTLTKNGENVEFSELTQGHDVEIEVKKVGKRLDPISVKIKE
ncbi:MAG: hypothetical protein PF517_12930 [Salinivirgaceae bacterium]|jgi:CspA family cold shock protein|nr:hypothetical protein [Salinivirgaceae bacterium]